MIFLKGKHRHSRRRGGGNSPAGVCIFFKGESLRYVLFFSISAASSAWDYVCVCFLVDSLCLHFNSQPGGSPSVVDEFINGQLSCVDNMVGSVEDYRLLRHCFILNAE